MVTSSDLGTAGEELSMIRRHLLWVMFVFHFDPLGSGQRFVKILFYIIETGGRDWISTPRQHRCYIEVLFLFKCWLGHKYLNCFGMQKFAAGRPKCKHSKWKKGFLVKGCLPFDVGLIHVLKHTYVSRPLFKKHHHLEINEILIYILETHGFLFLI